MTVLLSEKLSTFSMPLHFSWSSMICPFLTVQEITDCLSLMQPVVVRKANVNVAVTKCLSLMQPVLVGEKMVMQYTRLQKSFCYRIKSVPRCEGNE